MNPLKSAQITQRQIALETPCIEPDQLPQDIADLLSHFDGHSEFRVHGILRSQRQISVCYQGEERVDADFADILSQSPLVSIRGASGQVIRRVGRSSVTVRTQIQDWWCALVEGNAVSVERLLQEEGFPAIATSMNHVAIRPV